MKFKSKISKMGNRKIVNVPASIDSYFDAGQDVEVTKMEKKKKVGK